MGHIFNPVPDNDWQALNMLLEKLSYMTKSEDEGVMKSAKYIPETFALEPSDTQVDGVVDDDDDDDSDNTEPDDPNPIAPPGQPLTPKEQKKLERQRKKAEKKAKKLAAKEAKKLKKVKVGTSSEYSTNVSKVTSAPVVGVAGEQGIETYSEAPQFNITLPKDAVLYRTQAKIAVPSSYYLDLRGKYLSSSTQQYTADLLVLRDSNGNTLTIEDVDETNDINDTQTASVAGKRDQAAAFTAETWIYFFIIYNPTTGDISSLSSASATAPTLPTGYTFYIRVGSVYFTVYSTLTSSRQVNDKIYLSTANAVLFDAEPVTADVYESVDLSEVIPPTAKAVGGYIGTTSSGGLTGLRGVAIAPDSGGAILQIVGSCDPAERVYGLVDGVYFDLPVLTSQTMWWTASSEHPVYGLQISWYQDDL